MERIRFYLQRSNPKMSEFPVVTRYEIQGAETVIQTNARLLQSYQQGETSVKDFNKSLRENMEGFKAQNSVLSANRMAMRVQYNDLLQFGRVMSNIGSVGNSLLSMWQAYTIGQIRVEQANQGVAQAQLGVAKAHAKVEDAQKEVAKWQKIYNEYLRDFGSDSAYTKAALDSLTQAQEYQQEAQSGEKDAMAQVVEEMRKAAQALESLTVGYIGIGLQSVGAAANVANLIVNLKKLQGIGAILIPITVTVGIVWAVQQGIDWLSEQIDKAAGWEAGTFKSWQQFQKGLGLGGVGQGGIVTTHAPSLPSIPTVSGKPTITTPTSYTIAGGQPNLQNLETLIGIGGHYQFGTPYVPETALYLLHKGESVKTARENANTAKTANSFKVTLNIYPPSATTDPNAIAEFAVEKMKRWIATGTAM